MSHELTLWDDFLWVRYYDREQEVVKLRAVEAATGRVLRELDAPESLSAPLVRADEQWFGTSLFDRPYAFDDAQEGELSFPFEGEPEPVANARAHNAHTPLAARRDGTLLQSLYQLFYEEEDQSVELFYDLMSSRFEGEVERAASDYEAFMLTRQETLLTLESTKLLRATGSQPERSWSYEPGEGYVLTSLLLDIGEQVGVVVQRENLSREWVNRRKEPACELRLLNATSGEQVAAYPMDSTLLQRREQGELQWRSIGCGNFSFPMSLTASFVLEGEQAVWTVNGSGQTSLEHSKGLEAERIDVSLSPEEITKERILQLPDYFSFTNLMPHSGLLRGVGNGLLGLFLKDISSGEERPQRAAQLSYISSQGELSELYIFESQQPAEFEVGGFQGEVYYSWNGCRTPPWVDEQGRVFVILGEEIWDYDGLPYPTRDEIVPRPYHRVLYALEPQR